MLPAVSTSSVPFANFAGDSEKLGGILATNFLQNSALPICLGGTVLTYNGTVFTCIAPTAASSVSASTGSPSAQSISFSGNTNTGFYSPAANTIGISANGLNIFNISSAGLVSPTAGGASLKTANGTAASPTYSFAGDSATGWFQPAVSSLAAATAGAERIRIDTAGNVGIGTTTPSTMLDVVSNSTYPTIEVYGPTANTYPPSLVLMAGRTAGTTYPQLEDFLGIVSFRYQNNTQSANVYSMATENHSASAAGGNVIFNTTGEYQNCCCSANANRSKQQSWYRQDTTHCNLACRWVCPSRFIKY